MLTGPCKVCTGNADRQTEPTCVLSILLSMLFPLGLAPDTRINSAHTSLKVCNLRNSSAR